jgi:peptide/nickel transport system substrate-binding protein
LLFVEEDIMLKKSQSRSLIIASSIIAVLILLLSACAAPTVEPTGKPVKGGIWIDDLFEEPGSLIPNASPLTFAAMVDQSIYASLFYGDAQGTLHPGLVTEIPTIANGGINGDLTIWKFHMRPGLKWSDGQPLDARDVDYTWRLWTNPKFAAVSTVGINLITAADVSSDNLTITFHLKTGFEPFLSIWSDGINAPIPAHHFSDMAPGKVLSSPDNLNPTIDSGPFMMADSKPGDHYTVKRNPNYYRAAEGLPYLDQVVFRIVTNQDTILKDLQAGKIDSSWSLDITKTIDYRHLTHYKLTTNPLSTNYEAMYFNFHNPILGKHPAIRQAMAMAIDHQALIDTARHGFASALCTDHAASLHPGFQRDAPCPKFDVTAANALLDLDGWTKKDAAGYRYNGNQKLDFKYSTTTNNPWRAGNELILQQDFKAIGIKLEIQNYPASTFYGFFLTGGNASPATGAVAGRYDIGEFENSLTYDADDMSVFACNQFPPAGFNIAFYCNHNLDKLYQQEQQMSDPSARQQAFNQIHQIYLLDYPFIILYSPSDIGIHKLTVHNYNPGPEGAAETINIWEWWCDKGHC